LRIPSLIAARQRPKLGHFNSLLLDLFQIDKDQLPRCCSLNVHRTQGLAIVVTGSCVAAARHVRALARTNTTPAIL
jgi:hypothetical protein